MTTRVTVDAHAGWPVEVILLQGEPASGPVSKVEVVEPKTTRDFHLHSGCTIVSMRELKRPEGT